MTEPSKAVWSLVRRVGHRVGVDISRYPPRHLAQHTLAWQIQRVLERRTIDLVIDVGAHWGEFATMIREDVGYHGPIVSLEPASASFSILSRRFAADRAWSGHQCAAGEVNGEIELNVFDSTNLNSAHRPSPLGVAQLEMETHDTETVRVVRLDEISLASGRLLLKTDTQGFDLHVLRGAGSLLARTEAIVTELAVRNIYDDETPALAEIIDHLSSMGFELVGLHPVLHDVDRLRVIEFDGVFVRADGGA